MVSLGALPSNHDVLLARFQIPAGLDVDKPSRNIGKFLTSADYAYGRILPRGEEHGSNLYDMVLAKRGRSPPWSTRTGISPAQNQNHACSRWAWTIWANRSTGNMKDTFHLLISGKSGTGKSSIAQIVVAEALLKGHDIILIGRQPIQRLHRLHSMGETVGVGVRRLGADA